MTLGGEGVVLLITAAVSDLSLSEPVFVDFSIQNGLSEGIRFDMGHNSKSNLKLTVTDPQGTVSYPPKLSEEGLGLVGRVSLRAGEKYLQRLLVNEWYPFGEPGEYKIEISLDDPIISESGAEIRPELPGAISVRISQRDLERLNRICQDLFQKAVDLSDAGEAAEAALALSYIRDPAVVPYLRKGLRQDGMSWQYGIAGLARIANAESIDVLIAIMGDKDPESGSELARYFLYKIKAHIQDPALKLRIEGALN